MRRTQVLVPDDGLGDALGERYGSAELRPDEVKGELAAVELEAEVGRCDVPVGSGEVVHQAGAGVGLVAEMPRRELLSLDGLAWRLNKCSARRPR